MYDRVKRFDNYIKYVNLAVRGKEPRFIRLRDNARLDMFEQDIKSNKIVGSRFPIVGNLSTYGYIDTPGMASYITYKLFGYITVLLIILDVILIDINGSLSMVSICLIVISLVIYLLSASVLEYYLKNNKPQKFN